MNSPHLATWWLRPEEVAAVVELDGRRTDLIFESDDGTLWEFRLGTERFGWDHSIHSLVYGTDRAAIDDAVRTKLKGLGWARECWALTRTEQAVLDEATKGLRADLATSARKLRQLLRPTFELDEVAFATVTKQLCPRFLEEQPGTRGPFYTPSFGGLLRSSEATTVQAIVETVVALLRRKYDADADFSGYSLDEVMSEGGRLDGVDRRFVDSIIVRSFLALGGNGTESNGVITRNYGVPDDIDPISECRTFEEFMRVTRRGRSAHRCWPTAPRRLGGFIPERVRARLVAETATPPTRGGYSEPPPAAVRPTEIKAVKYDVALSFAGEDRTHAEALASFLRSKDVKVFYDAYEKATLWGKDLYVHLHKVYSEDATYCVLFVSKHYAEKLWTSHERQAAQERAFKERGGEYILPVRIDGTSVPGLPTTVGYLDIKEGIEEIGQMVLTKLGRS